MSGIASIAPRPESEVAGQRVPAPARARRRRGIHSDGRRVVWYLAPWFVGTVVLVALPTVLAVYWSFTRYDLFSSPEWVGLQNYTTLFHDAVFIKSVTNTLYTTVIGVVAGTAMGLGSAVLLAEQGRTNTVLRAVVFMPAVVPPVATGIVWTFILNPEYGLLDAGLRAVGLAPIGWLSDPAHAKLGLVMMVLWGSVGQVMITFVAALHEVPEDVLEAASLDGAGRFRTFWSVVFPTLRPVLLYNVVIATLFYFQFFEQAFVVNPSDLGAPGQSTLTYAVYLYQQAFTFLRMGSAAAMSVLLLLASSLVIVVFFAINRRLER
ncbi:sugar ABC transporter permease [Curtobacterium sp. MCBD17_034]|uniref:carbohydrate ABC transporter permease n=1 Tax=unclassified Curtobacterium TaxID=257496 RepID=UPI000DA966F3|nr:MULTISPECIES: sugar ABC transporter permease [unclassified Curtobacterium]PZF58461.1 sugar ABC transporter permease [Curtobacterium sp. MCBD17_034]PZM34450.1 sugar ABC transporter permease [Curtobacterium sp. MCBD17_031]